MAAPDATLDVLDKLGDESLWDVRDGVPIFCEHERPLYGADGSPVLDHHGKPVVRKVDVPRLKRIVANARRLRAERGVLPRITIGHTKKNPDAPEQSQPDHVGLFDDLRLGTFGPEKIPCILARRFYAKADHDALYLPDGRERYPYRSAEFWSHLDEITGVALLKRDPQLDLGLTTYARGPGGGSYFYAMGDEPMPLPDPTQPPMPAPVGAPPLGDGPPPGPGGDDEYTKLKGHMDRYVREHPVLGPMCAKPAGGGMDGLDDQDGGPPPLPGAPPKKPDDKPADYQRHGQGAVAAEMLQMRQEMARIKAERAAELVQYNRAAAKAVIAEFDRERIILDDRKGLYESLAKADDAGRAAKRHEVLTNYQRDITGGSMLDIAADPDAGPDDLGGHGRKPGARHFDERDLKHAEDYMRKHANEPGDHEVKWNQAEEYALSQRGKLQRR